MVRTESNTTEIDRTEQERSLLEIVNLPTPNHVQVRACAAQHVIHRFLWIDNRGICQMFVVGSKILGISSEASF